jgi:glutathione S-transferase
MKIFYSGTKNASSWAFRAWLSLKEANVLFEEVIIDIRRPQRLVNLEKIADISPAGSVPVFVDGECVIFDSLAIMEYANELSGNRLLPAEMKARARARSMLAWVHSGMSGICSDISFESAFAPPPAQTPLLLRSQIEKLAAILEKELGSHTGPYLAGNLSLADLAFVPVMIRLQSHQPDMSRWPHLSQWQERLLKLPSVMAWMTEAKKLPAISEIY